MARGRIFAVGACGFFGLLRSGFGRGFVRLFLRRLRALRIRALRIDRGRNRDLARARFFALMSKNATSATDFFKIPNNRVVELGTQLVI